MVMCMSVSIIINGLFPTSCSSILLACSIATCFKSSLLKEFEFSIISLAVSATQLQLKNSASRLVKVVFPVLSVPNKTTFKAKLLFTLSGKKLQKENRSFRTNEDETHQMKDAQYSYKWQRSCHIPQK